MPRHAKLSTTYQNLTHKRKPSKQNTCHRSLIIHVFHHSYHSLTNVSRYLLTISYFYILPHIPPLIRQSTWDRKHPILIFILYISSTTQPHEYRNFTPSWIYTSSTTILPDHWTYSIIPRPRFHYLCTPHTTHSLPSQIYLTLTTPNNHTYT